MHFQKALNAGTEKTGTLYNLLASCEMQLGDYQSALNHYNLGLQSEGNSAELTQEMEFNQIAAYEKLYDWESAKAKIEEYIAKYPDDEAAKKEAEFFADKIKIRGSGDYSLPSIFSIKFFLGQMRGQRCHLPGILPPKVLRIYGSAGSFRHRRKNRFLKFQSFVRAESVQ